MLSGPQQKFCEGIVAGENATAAYRAAYPKSSAAAARRDASRLLTNADVKAEIARQRGEAEKLEGSSIMTLVEKRRLCALIARSAPALLPVESPLWQSIKHTKDGVEYRLPCKISAIKLDNDLEGVGSEAEANKAIAV